MDDDIKFCQSAFKHSISEADIRWAIDTIKYDGCLEGDEDAENKRLLIGFDRNANLIEIYSWRRFNTPRLCRGHKGIKPETNTL
jgi:hypothetical protein